MRLHLLLAVLVLAPFAWAVDARALDGEKTAAQLAAKTLDSFRDKAHKEKVRILWPARAESGASAPAAAEAYLIRGYIDYTCTRFVLREGSLRVERIGAKRTWFYNPDGESYVTEQFEVRMADFFHAWLAARLLIAARPSPPPGFGSHRRSISSFSNERHVWVRLRPGPGQPVLYENEVRSTKRRDGIQDFDELRTRAVFQVFAGLLPQGREAPSGKPFPLTEWASFLTEEVREGIGRIPDDLTQEDIEVGDELLLETSLRILGETGHGPALPVVKALQERLADATEQKFWRACWRIHREAGHAMVKIRLLNRWDASEAVALIHRNPRHSHAENDLAKWLLTKWIRARFFEHDPEAYFGQLVADVAARAHDVALLRDTVAELAARYPGRALAEIRGLLDHASPEVAADAAFVLLKSLPDDAGALTVLGRLAGDAAVKIPPHAEWFWRFARIRALAYLYSEKAPESVRWNSERVRRQLAQPGEDGRMVYRLLSALDILRDPAADEEKVEAYRRVLPGPRNKGILVACKELIGLKDRASAPAIRRILDEIAAGCKKSLSWEPPDPQALYPWADRHDLEPIRRSLEKLEGP